jgi:hypothetical protein
LLTYNERIGRGREVASGVATNADLKSFQEACARIVEAASDAIFRPGVVGNIPARGQPTFKAKSRRVAMPDSGDRASDNKAAC